ncbi:hypothetical protein EDB83DRAFT_2461387 [Lactarius deliciosus]|nr:hypothetical protein EDB83DRAFT_2461387 [Lactarius deliciosus]
MPTHAPTTLCSPMLIASILRTVPASRDTFGQTHPQHRSCRRLRPTSVKPVQTESRYLANPSPTSTTSLAARGAVDGNTHGNEGEGEEGDEGGESDMVRYFRMRDGLTSIAVSEPVPASLAYSLQPGLHGWARVPVRHACSLESLDAYPSLRQWHKHVYPDIVSWIYYHVRAIARKTLNCFWSLNNSS